MVTYDGKGSELSWRVKLPNDLANKVNGLVRNGHLSPSEVFEIAVRVMDNASREDIQRAYEATLSSRAKLFEYLMGFGE